MSYILIDLTEKSIFILKWYQLVVWHFRIMESIVEVSLAIWEAELEDGTCFMVFACNLSTMPYLLFQTMTKLIEINLELHQIFLLLSTLKQHYPETKIKSNLKMIKLLILRYIFQIILCMNFFGGKSKFFNLSHE